MPLPALVVQGAGFLASMALWEGIAAIFEHMNAEPGNEPEAILTELQRAQQAASREALWEVNKDARIQGGLAKQFGGISPQSSLGQMALLQGGTLDRTDTEKYPTLNFVTNKLGMHPDEFVQRTSPTRMGDMTNIQRALPPMMREQTNAG